MANQQEEQKSLVKRWFEEVWNKGEARPSPRVARFERTRLEAEGVAGTP
jgi:hypothetical protein